METEESIVTQRGVFRQLRAEQKMVSQGPHMGKCLKANIHIIVGLDVIQPNVARQIQLLGKVKHVLALDVQSFNIIHRIAGPHDTLQKNGP
jgi:hypothetical protein